MTAGDDFLVAVNTDPHHVQETMVHVPIHEMGIDDDQPYVVRDLLSGARYTWRGVRNYVRLDPNEMPGHVLLVERERGHRPRFSHMISVPAVAMPMDVSATLRWRYPVPRRCDGHPRTAPR